MLVDPDFLRRIGALVVVINFDDKFSPCMQKLALNAPYTLCPTKRMLKIKTAKFP